MYLRIISEPRSQYLILDVRYKRLKYLMSRTHMR